MRARPAASRLKPRAGEALILKYSYLKRDLCLYGTVIKISTNIPSPPWPEMAEGQGRLGVRVRVRENFIE